MSSEDGDVKRRCDKQIMVIHKVARDGKLSMLESLLGST